MRKGFPKTSDMCAGWRVQLTLGKLRAFSCVFHASPPMKRLALFALLPLCAVAAPPAELAVALEYEKGSREAPRVIAKGRGLIAERIIALAEENDIVIEANPALAKALSGVELEEEIPVELFEAVAEIIGFVLRARARA